MPCIPLVSSPSWDFTTNGFQAFDIGLTVGTNQITLHAQDLAGNVTTTNLSYWRVKRSRGMSSGRLAFFFSQTEG